MVIAMATDTASHSPWSDQLATTPIGNTTALMVHNYFPLLEHLGRAVYEGLSLLNACSSWWRLTASWRLEAHPDDTCFNGPAFKWWPVNPSWRSDRYKSFSQLFRWFMVIDGDFWWLFIVANHFNNHGTSHHPQWLLERILPMINPD